MGHSRASLKTLSTLPHSKGSLLLVPAQGRVGRNVTLGTRLLPTPIQNEAKYKTFQIRELLS